MKYYPKEPEGKSKSNLKSVNITPNLLIAKRYLVKLEIRQESITVFHMAFDRENDRNVAITLLPKELTSDPETLAELKHDLELAQDLQHESIVPIYQMGVWQNLSYITMEYVPSTLSHILDEKGGMLPINEAIEILKDLAQAIDYAHDRSPSVSHLGLRPTNILITDDNKAKIADFGLANFLGRMASGTDDPEILGYLAPEQVTGEEAGKYTDVYALAALAYKILYGKPPFSEGDIREKIINDKVKPISGLSEYENKALELGLSKDISLRPQSATAFVSMLAGKIPVPDAAQIKAIKAEKKPKPSAPKPLKKDGAKPEKSKKSPIIPLAVCLIILAIAGVVFWVVSQKGQRPASKTASNTIVNKEKVQPVKKLAATTESKKKKPQEISAEKQKITAEAAETLPQVQEEKNVITKKIEQVTIGNIDISSTPSKAQIYLDGSSKGNSPAFLNEIEEGSHKLKLKKQGYETWSSKILVKALVTNKVVVKLKPIYGKLEITSKPDRAAFYLDKKKMGTTPIKLDRIKKGTRKITIKRDGFDTFEQEVSITPGTTFKLMVELSSAFGSLKVASNPSGADIFIKGIKQGTTPALIKKVKKGRQNIKVKKKGYDTWSQDVNITPGEMMSLVVELGGGFGDLRVKSLPDGADVYLSGIKKGKTPLGLKNINRGKVDIEIRKECYKTKKKQISIAAGKTINLDFTLKPSCGSISVKTIPKGAKWFLDGKPMGVTPEKVKNIKDGNHDIKITKNKYMAAAKDIVVEPGKTTAVNKKLKLIPPKTGDLYHDPLINMDFIWVGKGCYKMGSPSGEFGRNSDESPVHKVCVDGFWIGKFEVTQGQWKRIMQDNPSFFTKGDKYPIEQVTWRQAMAFITKVNKIKKGKAFFRLPTEAEWEYACRGRRVGSTFSGGDRISILGWYKKNSKRTTHVVGKRLPNSLNLYDMSGNVAEWVEDIYSSEAYKRLGKNNPVFKGSGSERVYRGGSWRQAAKECRSAARGYFSENGKRDFIGFRIVKTQQQ